ncbi:GntR family transcriptional regulator [uncultured Aquabacterium sp.]|uniref:GntR family transcriptional regulator n=1 Tax=Aquabacterium sp. TaxID=1872578 RepID=UPI0025ED9A5B|nr:GntR family transcriptional regulator [uncultured Aquabacterium sp.]
MKLVASSSPVLPPTALPATTLAERVYAQIKQLIFDFVLLPGDRFSESDLANQVQVSRTPLRQALQRLQREGFLLVFPKSGWQVAPLDFDAFDQLYDLRILLETHAVARLCEAEVRPVLDELAAVWLIPPGERAQAFLTVDRLDEAFHAALVRATGNDEMTRVHADITERIRIIRRLDFTKPQRVEATYNEHATILRAITRRRADEAQRLLRAHIEHSKLEVRRITIETLYHARQRLAEVREQPG